MPANSASAPDRLCKACGLCCNGVLFADVKVGPNDRPATLTELGLRLRRRGASSAFDQPCAALRADGHCGIYAERPRMCRAFECGVLQEVIAGTLTEAGALRVIRRAKKLTRKVTDLLQRSGNQDTHRPLTRRYQAVMRTPIDLTTGKAAGERRGELMLAVHELMELVKRRFLRPERSGGGSK